MLGRAGRGSRAVTRDDVTFNLWSGSLLSRHAHVKDDLACARRADYPAAHVLESRRPQVGASPTRSGAAQRQKQSTLRRPASRIPRSSARRGEPSSGSPWDGRSRLKRRAALARALDDLELANSRPVAQWPPRRQRCLRGCSRGGSRSRDAHSNDPISAIGSTRRTLPELARAGKVRSAARASARSDRGDDGRDRIACRITSIQSPVDAPDRAATRAAREEVDEHSPPAILPGSPPHVRVLVDLLSRMPGLVDRAGVSLCRPDYAFGRTRWPRSHSARCATCGALPARAPSRAPPRSRPRRSPVGDAASVCSPAAGAGPRSGRRARKARRGAGDLARVFDERLARRDVGVLWGLALLDHRREATSLTIPERAPLRARPGLEDFSSRSSRGQCRVACAPSRGAAIFSISSAYNCGSIARSRLLPSAVSKCRRSAAGVDQVRGALFAPQSCWCMPWIIASGYQASTIRRPHLTLSKGALTSAHAKPNASILPPPRSADHVRGGVGSRRPAIAPVPASADVLMSCRPRARSAFCPPASHAAVDEARVDPRCRRRGRDRARHPTRSEALITRRRARSAACGGDASGFQVERHAGPSALHDVPVRLAGRTGHRTAMSLDSQPSSPCRKASSR